MFAAPPRAPALSPLPAAGAAARAFWPRARRRPRPARPARPRAAPTAQSGRRPPPAHTHRLAPSPGPRAARASATGLPPHPRAPAAGPAPRPPLPGRTPASGSRSRRWPPCRLPPDTPTQPRTSPNLPRADESKDATPAATEDSKAVELTNIEPQRSSSDIVAKAQEVRQSISAAAEKKKAATTAEDAKAADDDLRRDLAMDEHKMEMDAVADRHGGDQVNGLTTAEAEARLERDGKNQLTPPPKDPEWLKFFREMTGFFSLLLWAGAGLCFLAYGIKEEADNLYLGVVLAVVVWVTGCFSYWQNRKSEDLMASFKNMMEPEITVQRDGAKTTIATSNLVKGDVVFLVQGNKVPADLRVMSCTENAAVDNSSLTGEAEPQKRSPDCTHESPLETRNLAFFGTSLVEGSLKGMVVACGDGTVMGRIAALATSTEDNQTPINREIEHFVHIVSGVAMVLGVSFFIVGAAIKTDYLDNLVFVIGIIVANVPEGLLATVTVCLTLTANRMHGKQVMVKKLEGVETLGSTSCICSDKTGTLTQNIMTIREVMFDNQVWSADEFEVPEGWDNQVDSEAGSNAEADTPLHRPSFRSLQRCATLCNTTEFDEKTKKDADGNDVPFKVMKTLGDGSQMQVVAWDAIGDASETAMVKFVQDKRDIMNYRAEWEFAAKVPFNSTNKFQVHVEHPVEGGDNWVFMKGAPERVLERCTTALIEGEEVPLDDELRASFARHQEQLSAQGYRVLGFCEKHLDSAQYPRDYTFNSENWNFPMGNKPQNPDAQHAVEQDPKSEEGLCYIGMMALIDPPRPQVPGAVAKCKTAGIKVIMVTGDHPVTAKAIAHQVGILWGDTKDEINQRNAEAGLQRGDAGWEDPDDAPAIVVPGWEISVDTPEEEWEFILDHRQIVFARTSPQQKLLIVEHCQARREVVAVTGDGVNDSPALKKADIGVAMGITGSEVSKEAADMILLDDNFASIVSGVEEGRLIFDNLKKSIAYTLSSNIPEISPFLCFITLQTPLPLSTVLILAVDLGTDMIPAISMAYETAESDIMKRPPRNAAVDRLVTKKLVSFAYLQIGVIQAAAGFFTWMVVLNDYGFPPHLLMGLGVGDYWGKQPIFCKFDGGSYVDQNGDVDPVAPRDPTTQGPSANYPLWREDDTGDVTECAFPLKNFKGSSTNDDGLDWQDPASAGTARYTDGWAVITTEAMDALEAEGYFLYIPYKGRRSPFWDKDWLSYDITDDDVPGLGDAVDAVHFTYQPVGEWSIAGATKCAADLGSCRTSDDAVASGDAKDLAEGYAVPDPNADDDSATLGSLGKKRYRHATLSMGDEMRGAFSCGADNTDVCQNVASRMVQKEALHHAQGAFFVCIVVVQWADLLICRTRWLSIRSQGMSNSTLNFGLFFETLLAAWLCYIPAINRGLGTRNIRLTHWVPGMPFSMMILMYDETRKYLMRTTSITHVDPVTGRSVREPGWLERNTYY